MLSPVIDMQPAPGVVDQLVDRIAELVQPLRIILFGSAARGEMGPDSDLDVLVVMPDGVHRRETGQLIYRHLLGLGFATDVVVVTQSDIERYVSNPYMIISPALDEGKELYHDKDRLALQLVSCSSGDRRREVGMGGGETWGHDH